MPAITAKTEGKGNGIKTNVTNLLDVSRAINRPNEHVLKFFGFELGAQTKLDYKTDKFLVNGVHDPAKLQNVLDIYIKKYVLCDSCMNPETTFQFYGKANSKKVGEITWKYESEVFFYKKKSLAVFALDRFIDILYPLGHVS